jgi:hypothetical protein
VSLLAAIRPDEWNVPLFLHVLGAMALVGTLVLAGTGLAGVARGDGSRSLRLAYRSLLIGALPAWIVMRVAAQWVADEEGLGDEPPQWVDIGFMTSEPTFLLIIVATILTGVGARKAARDGGGGGTQGRIAAVLIAISLIAYVFAIWAMTTKPT